MKKSVACVASSLVLAVAGCTGKQAKAPTAKPINVSLGGLVQPSATPTPVSRIDKYAARLVELYTKDRQIASELAAILRPINPESPADMKVAAPKIEPLAQRAKALTKEYNDLEAPDELQNTQGAMERQEKAITDELENLHKSMLQGDPDAYSQALDSLRTKSSDAVQAIDSALARDGYDPEVWNSQQRLVAKSGSSRTGL